LLTRTGFFALALALLLGGAGVTQATHLTPPPALDQSNPYKDDVTRARQALDQSIERFWADYYANPWDFQRLQWDYDAYVRAWYDYMYALSRYYAWERQSKTFSGRVLTREGPRPIPVRRGSTAKQEQEGKALTIAPFRDAPIAGAAVVVTRNVRILYKADQSPQTQDQPAERLLAPQTWRQVTDRQGNFAFGGLGEGDYRYTVTHEGYLPASGLFTLGKGPVKRQIYLSTMRRFNGVVLTVPAEVYPIIRPLLAKSAPSAQAGQQTQEVSAETVEKLLSQKPGLAPPFKRTIPLEGARVRLSPPRIPIYKAEQTGQAQSAQGADAQAQSQGEQAAARRILPGFPDRWPTAVTGSKGQFHFANLYRQAYEVTVEKEGYTPFRGLVSLDDPVTFRRIVVFPWLSEPPRPYPVRAQEQEAPSGTDVENPFGK
jgi:hypothetical protein